MVAISNITMPAKLSINDVDVAGKRVFMRVDFNVPQECVSFFCRTTCAAASCNRMTQDKADPTKITNTQRIDGALPTIKKAPWCRGL